MWKLRAGLVCIVNSFIFETSSFFDFNFLASFLHEQCRVSLMSVASTWTRESPRAMAASIKASLDSEIGTDMTLFSSVTVYSFILGSRLVNVVNS